VANNWLTLEELKETMEWIRLSPKQRELVTLYIQNDYSKAGAVKTLYKCSTPQSFCTTINRVFGNAEVKAALSTYFKQSELDKFKEEVRQVLRGKRISPTRVAALRVLAKAHNVNLAAMGELEAAATEEKVVAEKTFSKDGKTYRTTVTEVSE